MQHHANEGTPCAALVPSVPPYLISGCALSCAWTPCDCAGCWGYERQRRLSSPTHVGSRGRSGRAPHAARLYVKRAAAHTRRWQSRTPATAATAAAAVAAATAPRAPADREAALKSPRAAAFEWAAGNAKAAAKEAAKTAAGPAAAAAAAVVDCFRATALGPDYGEVRHKHPSKASPFLYVFA